MLDLRKNREMYGDAILPPYGYVLDKAVTTTYSLDFDTLIAVSLVLGLNVDSDSIIFDDKNEPENNQDLESKKLVYYKTLSDISDKLLVFCEAGQMNFPHKDNKLTILIERMIEEVKVKNKNNEKMPPAFHPKTWLLVYKKKNQHDKSNKEEKLYRLLVLSRNLTYDKSWDIIVSMNGKKVNKESENSKKLISFLDYLKFNIDENNPYSYNHIKIIEDIVNEIKNVDFEIDDKSVSNLTLMSVGIGKEIYDINSDELFNNGKEKYDNLVVMSPFISEKKIEQLINKTEKLTLITREEELNKIKNLAKIQNLELYIKNGKMQVEVKDNDIDINKRINDDIHAKIYIADKGNKSYMYLGSINASHRAFDCNVEFGIKLEYKDGYNSEEFLKDLWIKDEKNEEKENSFFVKVNFDDIKLETDEEKQKLQLNNDLQIIVKEIERMNPCAEVRNGKDIHLEFTNFCKEKIQFKKLETSITIFPYGYNSINDNNFDKVIEFKDLKKLEISQVFVVKVCGKIGSINDEIIRTIIIPTKNMPDDRKDVLITEYVNNKDDFITYFSLMLDDNALSILKSISLYKKVEGNGKDLYKNEKIFLKIYEKLLQVSYEDPNVIINLQKTINVLLNNNSEIVPKELQNICDKFNEAIKKFKNE